jgi:hypothetical protein
MKARWRSMLEGAREESLLTVDLYNQPEGHKNLGSGPVTRSFFELLDLRRLRGHDGDSELSIGRGTCFVNIVRRDHAQVLAPILGLALSLGRACQM